MLWDLTWLLPIPGGSWQQFTGQEILGACFVPHQWETACRLPDVLGKPDVSPQKAKLCLSNAML